MCQCGGLVLEFFCHSRWYVVPLPMSPWHILAREDALHFCRMSWLKSRKIKIYVYLPPPSPPADFGVTRVVDLVPSGRDKLVTSANKSTFLQLMANYYLNWQIFEECDAFVQGLGTVVSLNCLCMFDPVSAFPLFFWVSNCVVAIRLQDSRFDLATCLPRAHATHPPLEPRMRCKL